MKKNIIKTVIIIALVAIGIAIMAIGHFNFSLYYLKNVRVEIYLGKNFDIAVVAGYIKEILPEQEIIVETAGAYKDTISLTTTELSEEQLNKIVEKTNEVYETELTASSDAYVIYNSNVRGRDIFAPYLVISVVATIAIVTILVFIYGKEVGKRKVALTSLSITIAGQFLFYVVLSLTRVEINRIIPGASITIFIASMVYLISQFERIKEAK